jgi:hypothetical protein
LPQKRSLALVSILQGVAAAEIINTLHLRDFRSRAIFEFFNTIGAKRPLNSRLGWILATDRFWREADIPAASV